MATLKIFDATFADVKANIIKYGITNSRGNIYKVLSSDLTLIYVMDENVIECWERSHTDDFVSMYFKLKSDGDMYLSGGRKTVKRFPMMDYQNWAFEKKANEFTLLAYALSFSQYGRNPFHTEGGSVRRLSLNQLIGSDLSTESLQIWAGYAKQVSPFTSVYSHTFRGIVLYYSQSAPMTTVRETATSRVMLRRIPNYYLINIGYAFSGVVNAWVNLSEPTQQATTDGSQVPRELRKIQSYSTKVPSVLGFKEKPDNKGKFTPKFKNYYEKYCEKLQRKGIEKHNPLSPVYLGLELEYEVDYRGDKNDICAKVMELIYPHALCKSDGSLNDGLEIVTVPAVYEDQVVGLEKFFTNFPSELFSAATCGLHIHVSRLPFSMMTQGKMIAFMNNPANADFLTAIGGRAFNSYAKQDHTRGLTSLLRGDGGERYNVLNLRNASTLEFRLFSSTTDFTKIKQRMQFVLALAAYCKDYNLGLSFADHAKHENFIKWLATERKSYPELVAVYHPAKVKPSSIQQSI